MKLGRPTAWPIGPAITSSASCLPNDPNRPLLVSRSTRIPVVILNQYAEIKVKKIKTTKGKITGLKTFSYMTFFFLLRVNGELF